MDHSVHFISESEDEELQEYDFLWSIRRDDEEFLSSFVYLCIYVSLEILILSLV